MSTIVYLDTGGGRVSLTLKRAPKYLRFVMRGTDYATLDALDQWDDQPRDGETVYAAVIAYSSDVHLSCRDKDGRRYGRREKTATYELVPEQPDQETLRDTARWQAWAIAQHEMTQTDTIA